MSPGLVKLGHDAGGTEAGFGLCRRLRKYVLQLSPAIVAVRCLRANVGPPEVRSREVTKEGGYEADAAAFGRTHERMSSARDETFTRLLWRGTRRRSSPVLSLRAGK